MTIYLAKTLDNMKKYGDIYDLSMEPDDRVEKYVFGSEENEWLVNNVIDGINAECDTLLDDGDYDYISCEKCNSLIKLLNNINLDVIPLKCKELIVKILEYSNLAIEYKTGIAIEL